MPAGECGRQLARSIMPDCPGPALGGQAALGFAPQAPARSARALPPAVRPEQHDQRLGGVQGRGAQGGRTAARSKAAACVPPRHRGRFPGPPRPFCLTSGA